MKKTIDIIGSCVSRDCFNSKFVPEHSEYFTVNTYLPRIAIPALMTPGIEYNDAILSREKGAWYYECYYKAYGKNFLSILANNQSDYLLMDFYTDAYLGVREFGGQYITYMRNQRWTESIDRSRLGRRFNYCKNAMEYKVLWKQYFDSFMEFLAVYCPDICVILNGIKGSNHILQSNIRHMPGVNLEAMNAFWQELDDYAVQKYPGIIYFSYDKAYELDPEYPFGGPAREFVHFEKGYYVDFFNKLLSAGEERGEKNSKSLPVVNLLKNGDFTHGLKGWSYHNSYWKVEKIDEHIYAGCSAADEQTQDAWCWSDAVEVNGDAVTKYTLSFVYRARENFQKFHEDLLGVRGFKNARDKGCEEAVEEHRVKISEQSYTFTPKTKYIRIGLNAAMGEHQIVITCISLVKGENAIIFQKCLDELYFQSAYPKEDGLENCDKNLIGNGDFSECFRGWVHENADFLIRNLYGRNWVFLAEPLKGKGRYLWKWSDAIEVQEDMWYELAVDYIVFDKDSVGFKDCAGIRCFRNRGDWKIKSAVGTFHIGCDGIMPEVNKVYHQTFCFQPGSRFVRIGIHLERERPHLYVTNFCLSAIDEKIGGGG